MMKAAFLIWIIAAWTIERFTTQSRGSSASLLLHQLHNNGFNSLSGRYFQFIVEIRLFLAEEHGFQLRDELFFGPLFFVTE
jgi:hypothetical protein